MTLKRAKDLVYIHINSCVLSQNIPRYNKGERKMRDLGGDGFEAFENLRIVEVAKIFLDEQDLELSCS